MKTEQYDEILVLTNDEDRKCAKCGQELPLSHFNRKGDGYQPYCRECQHKYAKRWNLARWSRKQVILENYTLADIVESFPGAGKGDRKQYLDTLETIIKKLKRIMEYDKVHGGDNAAARLQHNRPA